VIWEFAHSQLRDFGDGAGELRCFWKHQQQHQQQQQQRQQQQHQQQQQRQQQQQPQQQQQQQPQNCSADRAVVAVAAAKLEDGLVPQKTPRRDTFSTVASTASQDDSCRNAEIKLGAPQGCAQGWQMKLGAVMPDFHCSTTHGDFTFHEFLDCDADTPYTILFTHPKDFTPVCTTELGRAEALVPEFLNRNVKLIALSCDSVDSHASWAKDILASQGLERPCGQLLSFPIISDVSREIVTMLGMLDPEERDSEDTPLPARALVVIGPDKKVKLSILYPATTGRSFPEILRVMDSLLLTSCGELATPADWTPGDPVVVDPRVPTEQARRKFKDLTVEELPSGKRYLRMVRCPELAGHPRGLRIP